MFFKGNGTERLDEQLFKNPTSEYRGAPFWAWNSSLDIPELEEQIKIFKQMGLGGFNMHVRQGLDTEYLSDEFMGAVKACAECAEREGMYAWAYDEDRWPSGCAGGILTKEPKNRIRYILMTVDKQKEFTLDASKELNEGAPRYLGSFKVDVDERGFMKGYSAAPHESGEGVRHFYAMTKPIGEPRFNGYCYADTMSREVMDKFIEVTYEAYKDAVGEHFGKSVPAIFTDEPQSVIIFYLKSGFDKSDARVPYTPGFTERFAEQYGYALEQRLPALFFATEDAAELKVKHDFHRLASDVFMEAFPDNIGAWCAKNGVMFTGHALGEDTLYEQERGGYETMRFYKEMQLPGIDCLCKDKVFTTAIQCRSVVNQMEKEGMLSELYGVTGWDYDFRGHKFQGDWQACLGVSIRCHHLAWQTMKGEGKRDYPASIFYQSPWYLEYKYLEDHYARLNTVLTRGKSAARVAVLHPIDTYYLKRASDAETAEVCEEMEERFRGLAYTLITDMVDFDYISESLLPELCPEASAPLSVGAMEYDLVIVSDCETLREHTLRTLEGFKRAGGRVLFVGNTPRMVEAVADERATALVSECEKIQYSPSEIRRAVRSFKNVFVTDENSSEARDIIHTERIDGSVRHVFFAKVEENPLPHVVNERELTIRIRGEYLPKERNTLTAEVSELPFKHEGGFTVIKKKFYDNDSLLLSLEKYCGESSPESSPCERLVPVSLSSVCDYELEEPNVLLLDMPEYSLNGSQMRGPEEIMRVDEDVRLRAGLPTRKTKVVQPYAIANAPEDNELVLRYKVVSEVEVDAVWLALEGAAKCEIALNGALAEREISGYYVDKHIDKVKLGRLLVGENVITVSMPFGERTDLEAMYLLGDFGVSCIGREPVIKPRAERLAFGDLTQQGLRFYGGNVVYESDLVLDEAADVMIKTSYFRGALVKVSVDGGEAAYSALSPYTVRFNGLKEGAHRVRFELFGNRYNTFSALHTLLADKQRVYIGPDYWRSEGDGFAYEYQCRPFGILKTPEAFKIIK